MPWSEEWRTEDRPEPSEIPEEYSLSANVAENRMLGYFAGVIGLAYVGLRLFGSDPTLVAGVPIMIWMMIGTSVLVMIGLYFCFSRENVSEEVPEIQTQPEVEHD